jgi:hypothetical protein
VAERKIDDIDNLSGLSQETRAKASAAAATSHPVHHFATLVAAEPVAPPAPVDINYPEPALLSTIVRDVAKWSGRNFVMEPGINTKLQIFAPRKLPPQKAYDLFITSLSVVGLRAVQVGEVVKIVPVQVIVVA